MPNDISDTTSRVHPILSKTRLPYGREINNRLVKAALYEHSSYLFGGPPTDAHYTLYQRWGHENWGMIITGNVQVSKRHGGLGRDVLVPEVFTDEALKPFRHWASVIHGEVGLTPVDKAHRPLAILQLCHTGRQSPTIIGGRWPFDPALAPSPVPLNLNPGGGISLISYAMGVLMFPTPREMTLKDIDEAVHEFVRGCQLAAETGFDGAELHASHGYLIAQFMSPKSNHRTDEYAHPLAFLKRVLTAIREPGVVPKDFVLGIKLNAADYVDKSAAAGSASTDADHVLDHFKQVVTWGLVDFIEISGGDYEHPDFMMTPSKSPRQAMFADFSRRAMKEIPHIPTQNRPRPLILLTGGLKTAELLTSALAQNHADILGLGRLSVVCPNLPSILAKYLPEPTSSPLNIPDGLIPDIERPQFRLSPLADIERIITGFLERTLESIPRIIRPEFPKLLGAGMSVARFTVLLRSVGYGKERISYPGEGLGAIVRMWLWAAPSPAKSRSATGRWFVLLLIPILMTLLWRVIN